MQLRLEALDGHLTKSLSQLYVITSDEHLLALEAADKIRRAARAQGYSERDVLTVERSFKWGELLAYNQALSLFGDKKLIDPPYEDKMDYRKVKDTLADALVRFPWQRIYDLALANPGYGVFVTARVPDREALFKGWPCCPG